MSIRSILSAVIKGDRISREEARSNYYQLGWPLEKAAKSCGMKPLEFATWLTAYDKGIRDSMSKANETLCAILK